MKERTKFLLEWERRWDEAEGGPVNLAELCRMFGISPPTGYAWVKRYRDVADLIVEARKLHPKCRRRPAKAAGVTAPFSDCNTPNDVWCNDFNG